MKQDDLPKVLDALGQRINRWYESINCGGCCVYAVIVAEELQMRGVETRIIVGAYSAKNNIERVKQRISNIGSKAEWCENGVWFNHVGVEFKYRGRWYHYDTDGANRRQKHFKQYEIYPGRLTVAEAKAVADEEAGWNESFNRDRIPQLKKHVKRYLATTLPQ